MLGHWSEDEVLTGGPRLVGVPKIKSAFATLAVRPNVKAKMSEIVFFIFLPFQSLSLPRIKCGINSSRERLIFLRTLCATLFTGFLLLNTPLFDVSGSTGNNGKKGAASLFD